MKKAILVVSFGTTYEETRQKNIVALETEVASTFKDYVVYNAYTSRTVKRILNELGIDLCHVPQTLEKMLADGIADVLVLPTHLLYGEEYDLICRQVKEYANKFNSVKFSTVLLGDVEKTKKVLEIVATENQTQEDEALVLMGHGTRHLINWIYPGMNYMAQEMGFENLFVCTVEGYPLVEDIITLLKKNNYKKILLMPLMLVAGDHAVNDMASNEEDSLKSILEQNGFEVRCLVKGLGEYAQIRKIYCDNVSEKI